MERGLWRGRWTFVPVVALVVAALGPNVRGQEPSGPRVWVASNLHGWIHLIDPGTNQVVRVLRDDRSNNGGRELCWVGGGGYSDLAVGEGRVWAVAPGEGVCGIDPALASPGLEVQGQPRTGQAAAGEGALWTLQGSWVTRVDPASGKVTATLSLDYDRTAHVAIAGGKAWISTHDEWDLFHAAAGGDSPLDSLRLGGGGASLVAGAGSLWAYGPDRGGGMYVWRMDPSSGEVLARIQVPMAPEPHGDHSLAVGEGGVWIGLGEYGMVTRLDPMTNALSGSLEVGEWVVDLAVGAGSTWVLTQGDLYGHVLRVDASSLEILARIPIDDGVGAIAIF